MLGGHLGTGGRSEEDGSSYLKILCYNIHGLKSKVSDFYFQQFLLKFDLIFLLETFVSEEDKDYVVNKLGSNFKLHFQHATRIANFGRFRGGIVSMIKLNSNFYDSLNKLLKGMLFYLRHLIWVLVMRN